jgi:hypothetical protein
MDRIWLDARRLIGGAPGTDGMPAAGVGRYGLAMPPEGVGRYGLAMPPEGVGLYAGPTDAVDGVGVALLHEGAGAGGGRLVEGAAAGVPPEDGKEDDWWMLPGEGTAAKEPEARRSSSDRAGSPTTWRAASSTARALAMSLG